MKFGKTAVFFNLQVNMHQIFDMTSYFQGVHAHAVHI